MVLKWVFGLVFVFLNNSSVLIVLFFFFFLNLLKLKNQNHNIPRMIKYNENIDLHFILKWKRSRAIVTLVSPGRDEERNANREIQYQLNSSWLRIFNWNSK